MTHRYLLCTLLLSCFEGTGFAQTPDWLWAGAIGSAENEYATAVVMDDAGSVFMTGYFQGTLDFDPGSSIANLTSAGGADIFVTKLDPLGNFVWAVNMGGTGTDQGLAIALDDAGNVHVSGYFSDVADMDPGTANLPLTSAGNIDMFACKLNGSGALIWARGAGGLGLDRANAIAVAPVSGAVFITGFFSATADLDPGPGTASQTSAGAGDVFVTKLDAAGDFVWASAMGGPAVETAYAITPPLAGSGDVCVTGYFSGTADFDPGAGTTALVTAGGNDVFVCSLNSAGALVWAKGFGGPGEDHGKTIAVETAGIGSLIIGGFFSGTVDMDPDAGSDVANSGGAKDAFVAKWDNAGDHVWAETFGGTDNDEVRAIVVDAESGICAAGIFNDEVDLDPGTEVFTVTSAGDMDMYVSRFTAAGGFVWGQNFGGLLVDVCSSLAVDPAGDLCVAGHFFSTSLAIGNETFINAGSYDIYTAVLESSLSVGIADREDAGLQSTLFPNPASTDFMVTMEGITGPFGLVIFDLNGRVVATSNSAKTERRTVDVSTLNEGLYIVQIQSDGRVEQRKLVIAK